MAAGGTLTTIGLGLVVSDEPELEQERPSELSATFLWNSSLSLKVSRFTGLSATGGARNTNKSKVTLHVNFYKPCYTITGTLSFP